MSSTFEPDRSGAGPLVLAGAACAVAIALLVLLVTRTPWWSPGGLPDAGELTRNGVAVVRVLVTVASVVCVGSLLAAAFLLPRQRSGRLDSDGHPAARTAAVAAAMWLVASFAALLFTTAESVGAPVEEVALSPGRLLVAMNALEQAKAWLVTTTVVLVVLLGCQRATTWTKSAGLFLLSLFALLPVAVTGHSATGGSHDIATSSLIYHLVAATLWIGGLVALLALSRSRHLVTAVHRFSRLALVCWVVMAVSGVLNAWVRVSPADLFTTSYGWLLLAKVATLLALGAFGYRHRRHTIRTLTWHQNRRPLIRLAALEILLMFVTVGIATALSRTPPPPRAALLPSSVELLIGYDLAGQPTVARLLFDWRFDLLFGVLAVLLAAAYLVGVRRLDRWPVGRTVAWLSGCLVLLVATSSGIGRYAPAAFNVHLLQQMLVAVVAPVLLVRGAPVLLAMRAAAPGSAPREWLSALARSRVSRLLTRPAVGLTLLVAPLLLLYGAGGFTGLVGNRWAYLAMNAYFLTAGYLFFWPVAGADPAPRRLSTTTRRRALVLLLVSLAIVALVVTRLQTILGEGFYWSLALPWTEDLLADQRLGAVAIWVGGGLPVLAALAVLFATRSTVNDRGAASV
ncbi:bifunctional copper resistance protein CopD/cytochrome c oxidase assembly protein [Actinophytocola sp.]|uniref:bifunctional copper resistance protein CopD/cytochrome c oxidase assembly protein n=1 Tax=Actinophytocola sp. TaxID=1872138 RepID=UPI002ED62AB0